MNTFLYLNNPSFPKDDSLEKRNLPKGILSLIASLFSGCTTRIIVNQEITNEIEIQRGLLQGAILSP